MEVKDIKTGKGLKLVYTGKIEILQEAASLIFSNSEESITTRKLEVSFSSVKEKKLFSSDLEELAMQSHNLPPVLGVNVEDITSVFLPGIGFIIVVDKTKSDLPTLEEFQKNLDKEQEKEGIVTVTEVEELSEDSVKIKTSYSDAFTPGSIFSVDIIFGEQYQVIYKTADELICKLITPEGSILSDSKYPIGVGTRIAKVGQTKS